MTTLKAPPSALHEILKWSANRPVWQRDALRRIIEQGTIIDTDVKELERICRAQYGADVSKDPAVSAVPLAKSHVPLATGTQESASLISISAVKNVDRLPSDQDIPFGSAPGLAIIYGDNGTGKSGYARIIKKACRARGAPPIIRQNAFSPPSSAKASAKIVFRVGGADVSSVWTDGATTDPRLSNVFVFDAVCADHYIGEDSAAAFTPHGLDVLPKLASACDAIRGSIQKEIDAIRSSIASVAANWKYDAATNVGKLVVALSATTELAIVEANCGLDSSQAQRLGNLREALKSDPLQKAKETRAAAARLQAFAEKVSTSANALAANKIDAIKTQIAEATKTEKVAKAFASGSFDSSYLKGTGTDLWREMWDAAKKFSEASAYPDNIFPFTGEFARCVLCQQGFDSETVTRLNAFDVFCKDKSQQFATAAANLLAATGETLARLSVLGPELEKLEADFGGMTPESRELVDAFVKSANDVLQVIKNNVATRVWKAPTTLATSPEGVIKGQAAAFLDRAKTEESAHDPEIRKKLVAERNELDAREWLAGVKTNVLAQIKRHKLIDKLITCQKDTVTNAITTENSDLTRQFVTDNFRDRFRKETKALALNTLDVKLEPIQGKKGETRFGLRLTSSVQHKVVDIASEGEKRCVALSAFLAELSQASHQSALVFDDPVSSLDHWHREKIAIRLVEEATTRQVIVFTHDVVFLNDLLANAERRSITPHILSLEWRDGVPGKFVQGLPWDSKPPIEQLQELAKDQKSVAGAWNPHPNDANVQAMRHVYSRLRATLERIVERELLAGVVSRFETQVQTGRLAKLIDIPAVECNEARRLIQRCHSVTDAHDPAMGKHAVVPNPTELAEDLAATEKLVKDIRARHKASSTAAGSGS